MDCPISRLRGQFPPTMLSDNGYLLLKQFLTYDPKKRTTCEDALKSDYFQENPLPIDPSMFPTWPAKSELSASEKANVKKAASPKPPSGKKNELFKDFCRKFCTDLELNNSVSELSFDQVVVQ